MTERWGDPGDPSGNTVVARLTCECGWRTGAIWRRNGSRPPHSAGTTIFVYVKEVLPRECAGRMVDDQATGLVKNEQWHIAYDPRHEPAYAYESWADQVAKSDVIYLRQIGWVCSCSRWLAIPLSDARTALNATDRGSKPTNITVRSNLRIGTPIEIANQIAHLRR